MLKKLQFIFCFVSLFIAFVKTTNAKDIFLENFQFKDLSRWSYSQNGGVNFNNGYMSLTSDQYFFPYIINKTPNIFPDYSDYTIEIKFRYTDIKTMGDGLGIGFTSPTGDNLFQFQIWAGVNDGYYFVYNDFSGQAQGACKDFSITKNLLDRKIIQLPFTYDWQILRVVKTASSFSIFMNNINIFNSSTNQCNPENIWFGNQYSGGSYTWTSLDIGYFKVIENYATKHKIIIIPGLGASWNTNAMVYNQNVDDDQWKMIPFAKNYDGLTSLLYKNGLVKGSDYFVWNYDWRQPVDTIADKLNNFIEKNISSGEKVDIVGHSLGGLVARVWYQDHKDDTRIGKIITLGSPHEGSIEAYDAWSGMKFSEKPDLTSIAINLLVQMRRRGMENDIDLVRKNFPVLKDVLPTNDFLKKNKTLIPLSKMESQNSFLKGKNSQIVKLDSLKTYSGMGTKTKGLINIGERSVFDKVLGIWPDGKPVSYDMVDGDGTVVKNSSRFEKAVENFYNLVSNHSSIVDNSINTLAADLSLGVKAPVVVNSDLSGNMLIFVGSPVEMSLKCNGSSPIDGEDGFIMIKKSEAKSCELRLTGTDNGIYHLLLADTDYPENWHYYENDVIKGENIKLDFGAAGNYLNLGSENPDFLYKQITEDIKRLIANYGFNIYLQESLKAVETKNNRLLLEKITGYRKSKKEAEITGRILDNLEILMAADYANSDEKTAMNMYKKALQEKSLTDRITGINIKRGMTPGRFSAQSYMRLEKVIGKLEKYKRDKNYPLIVVESNLAIKHAGEIW